MPPGATLAAADWPEELSMSAGSCRTLRIAGLAAACGALTVVPGCASARPVFPPVSLAETMPKVGRRWENISAGRDADWGTPPEHPDVDPPHEALQLRELFRELVRTVEVQMASRDFRRRLEEARTAAGALEGALRKGEARAAEAAFGRLGAACRACHDRYRD